MTTFDAEQLNQAPALKNLECANDATADESWALDLLSDTENPSIDDWQEAITVNSDNSAMPLTRLRQLDMETAMFDSPMVMDDTSSQESAIAKQINAKQDGNESPVQYTGANDQGNFFRRLLNKIGL